MRHPLLAILPLSSLLPSALASRPCPSTPSPMKIPWTVTDLTYDAPDPSSKGRAAIDSTISFYLISGGTDYSCEGTWPSDWDGWTSDGRANETRSLIWFSCIVNRGRMLDRTVSFAVDWKGGRLWVGHTYGCGDGNGEKGTHMVGATSVSLDLSCASSTTDGKPTRWTIRETQLTLTTLPVPASMLDVCTNTTTTPSAITGAGAGAGQAQGGWEITGSSSLVASLLTPSSSTPGTSSPPLLVHDLSTNTTYDCTSLLAPAASSPSSSPVITRRCLPLLPSLTVSFDPSVKILTLEQSGACPAPAGENGFSTKWVNTKGAAYVPMSCAPICGEDAAIWVGGQVEVRG